MRPTAKSPSPIGTGPLASCSYSAWYLLQAPPKTAGNPRSDNDFCPATNDAVRVHTR